MLLRGPAFADLSNPLLSSIVVQVQEVVKSDNYTDLITTGINLGPFTVDGIAVLT